MKAPVPENEKERLKALHRYEILNTGAEQQLDDLTLLASRICGTPIAMISLIDENQQWFKSKIGTPMTETSRDVAFCAHGILQAEVFSVPDAAKDDRFKDSPLVTEGQKIRFYAGAPLRTPEGHNLGMICVEDQVPRELTEEQKEGLRAISRQVVNYFELKRKVEELRQANEQLRRTEESLQLFYSAVEQSRESIIITDAELERPGPRITFVNPAFTTMTGYTAKEALGKTPRILQGPRTDLIVLERLKRELKRGDTFEGETINYRKNGEEFFLEWQIAPIRDSENRITHFVAIQRDITEKRSLQSRMAQSQKMETVGKLAGGIAHEFNSILTAIIGQAEMLLRDLPADERLRTCTTEIRQAADRAATLTRQLLAYGRKQILQPETLDLNRVITDIRGTLEHIMGRQVEVKVVTTLGLKPVKIDPSQMEQVILNIAMNASAAMPNGGKLLLEASNVTLDKNYVHAYPGMKAGGYVQLAISDTGEGMTEEVKSRIFEPFFSTRDVGQGTGLGLSTCDGIIRQSGGHINVYSEPSRGSTFRIYLPQSEHQRTKGTLPRPGQTPLPGGNETILLAEDDPSLLEMAATLLRSLGYNVLTAANGVEALSLKNKRDVGHIDLLLTDVVMPHMNGKELSDRMKAIYPHTKILFTSAYTENAIVNQGILNEGVKLLQKPFTPTTLATRVREVLDDRGGVK